MDDNHSPAAQNGETVLRARLNVLMFGLFIFAFLFLTGRQHWFELRPASTTAVAISNAAQKDTATVEPGA